MADIELVIKIPEEIYESRYGEECDEKDCLIIDAFTYAIANGIPLPKGHGRLGDLDELKKEMQNYHDDCEKTSIYTRLGFETAIAVVEDAKPIIEADKEIDNEHSDKKS